MVNKKHPPTLPFVKTALTLATTATAQNITNRTWTDGLGGWNCGKADNEMSWYKPLNDNSKVQLSQLEQLNVDLIKAWENKSEKSSLRHHRNHHSLVTH